MISAQPSRTPSLNKGQRSGRSARTIPPLTDARLLGPDFEPERQFNMAAEIRTYVRTLGPFLLYDYRRLRAEVRLLGMRETDEALEFVRRFFTVEVLSKVGLPSHINIDELSRSTQGAVLCARKLCFSSDIWTPPDFDKTRYPWFGYHLAGVGERLALAYAQHFRLDGEVCTERKRLGGRCDSSIPASPLSGMATPLLPSPSSILKAESPGWKLPDPLVDFAAPLRGQGISSWLETVTNINNSIC